MWSGTGYAPKTSSGRPASPLAARWAVTSSNWVEARVAMRVNSTGNRSGAR